MREKVFKIVCFSVNTFASLVGFVGLLLIYLNLRSLNPAIFLEYDLLDVSHYGVSSIFLILLLVCLIVLFAFNIIGIFFSIFSNEKQIKLLSSICFSLSFLFFLFSFIVELFVRFGLCRVWHSTPVFMVLNLLHLPILVYFINHSIFERHKIIMSLFAIGIDILLVFILTSPTHYLLSLSSTGVLNYPFPLLLRIVYSPVMISIGLFFVQSLIKTKKWIRVLIFILIAFVFTFLTIYNLLIVFYENHCPLGIFANIITTVYVAPDYIQFVLGSLLSPSVAFLFIKKDLVF